MPNLEQRLDDQSPARGGGVEPPAVAAPLPAPLAAAPEGLPRPSPRQLGYRLPAEWEPHEATWLTFPHLPENWPGCWEEMLGAWLAMVRELAVGERVELLVPPAHVDDLERRLDAAGCGAPLRGGRVRLHEVDSNDAWTRDTGPIFVVADDPSTGERRVATTEWRFNAWGGKYDCAADAAIAGAIGELAAARRFAFPFVLEGGSIDTDGAGTLLTTAGCLLRPTRNPDLDRAGLEALLAEGLGVDRVVWLGEGIEGDDTDGHVDDITRFVDAQTIVTVVEPDERDPNHAPLRANLEQLRALRRPDGAPYRIVELPMPPAVTWQGARLPASYANFYVANEVVLVPVFGGPRDAEVLEVIGSFFPGRRTVGIDARRVVVGLGAFHCLTQQQPAAWGPGGAGACAGGGAGAGGGGG